jgi:KDO2-lipid IV(A) lauroyltransferase
MERVREVTARGPAIFLTSHTGCWELLGAYLAIEGIPLDVVARRIYDERLERMLIDSRESAGMGNISRGTGTREIIRSLNAGRGIGFLIDQDIKNVKGEFVDFFGIPAHTATAPAQLALRRGIPILPILTYRDDNHCHHACIGEPLMIDISGDIDRDIHALTSRCSEVTEAFIREHPEQWVWFHERWKTRPPEKTL